MTEQNKHTPGPWTASGWTIRDRAGAIVGRANSDYLSDAALNPECLACAEEEEVREQGPGQREASANARLIAAAPALSGAARSAASSIRDYLSGEWDGSPEGWEAVLRRLDAAIAQAEGVIAADPGAQIRAEMDRAIDRLRERVGAEKVAALEAALRGGERRSNREYYRVQEGKR